MSSLSYLEARLTARAGLALLRANARFWPSVLPLAHAQLQRWDRAAATIPDPELKALALQKLAAERFNAEVAATLATLAPRAHRRHAIEAIVAYEVMYDYLDGLTEHPTSDPLRAGDELFQAFIDALSPDPLPARDYYRCYDRAEGDGGYLQQLVDTVRGAAAKLPAVGAITVAAQRAAIRCAGAQVRIHATPAEGSAQLRRWAEHEAGGSELGSELRWREWVAGAAASVLCVHALFAAAADSRTTVAQASALEGAYLYICSLSTLLDSLVDREQDLSVGEQGYIEHYDDHEELGEALELVLGQAVREARGLPDGPHHVMTLVGVVAYYSSAPAAARMPARAVVERLHRRLRPLITPTLATLRTWRAIKQTRPDKLPI